jgi:hypothetical protein
MGPTMRITEEEVGAMATAELRELCEKKSLAILDMKIQIEQAEYSVDAGEEIDPDWLHRLKMAHKYTVRDVFAISREIRRRKEARKGQVEQTFISVAKEILDADTFQAIMERTRELTAQDDQGNG